MLDCIHLANLMEKGRIFGLRQQIFESHSTGVVGSSPLGRYPALTLYSGQISQFRRRFISRDEINSSK